MKKSVEGVLPTKNRGATPVCRPCIRSPGEKNVNSPLETKRLILKPLDSQMVEEYNAYFESHEKEFREFFPLGDFAALRSKPCPFAEEALGFAVVQKDSQAFVGVADLGKTEMEGVFNLSYFVFEPFRHQGFALETVQELLFASTHNLFVANNETGVCETIKIACILARIHGDNLSSISVVKKAGFIQDEKGCFATYFPGDVNYYFAVE